jgi:hypothetical protein
MVGHQTAPACALRLDHATIEIEALAPIKPKQSA